MCIWFYVIHVRRVHTDIRYPRFFFQAIHTVSVFFSPRILSIVHVHLIRIPCAMPVALRVCRVAFCFIFNLTDPIIEWQQHRKHQQQHIKSLTNSLQITLNVR